MSSEFNDMDRIFAEGLQNYEVTPPAHIWKNIQNQKRKALFLYRLKMASVILLLMISGGAYFMFSHYNITQPKIKSVNTTEKAYKNLDLTENKNTEPIMIEQKSVKLKPTYSQAINQSQKINRKAYKNSASQKTVHNNINVDNIVMTPMDNEFNLIAKNKIKLRYLIYPSLTQYVYTTKRFKPKYIKVNDKKEVEKLNHHFSIEIGGGPSYAFRKLSGDENGLRNESESALISLQTGLKVNYHFNPKWSVQTGLIIENRNEKLNYKYSETQKIITQTPRQVTVYHPVLPPKTITVIDSTSSNVTTENHLTNNNRYQSFNIPAVVGYSFSIGKLNYRVSTGSLINIYSLNTAKNLSIEGNNIEQKIYKESTKIKYSGYGAVGLLYPVNQNFQLITEFSYYVNLVNRLGSESNLSQKNYGYNLSVIGKFNLSK